MDTWERRGREGGWFEGKEGRSYSTTPAELITMSTEPRSEVILATTSAIAFSSRTSAL